MALIRFNQKICLLKHENIRNIILRYSSTEIDLKFCNENYKKYYDLSITNPNYFWGELAKEHISWKKPFTIVNNSDILKGKNEWFVDGMLNISENCLDRHVNNTNPAIIWEKDELNQAEYYSFKDLLKMTCKISNLLKEHGIQRNDTVCIYMPTSPLAVASMLACARIGAIHCVVFAGFSDKSLLNRINDSNSKILITTDGMKRAGKYMDLMKIVDSVVSNKTSLKSVFIWNRFGNIIKNSKYQDFLHNLEKQKETCEPLAVNSEDPLFVLYTSGSTGKPKGLIHTQAGYLLHATVSTECIFGCKKSNTKIIGSLVDIGWISGHTYVVYGPLSNGLTSVLFESTPNYPTSSRYWQTIEQHKINHIYTSPTAIRSLIKAGDEYSKSFDLSSLVTLGSVGEPINEEAWNWYNEKIGKKRTPIVDTWWQTETGGVMMSPRPGPLNINMKPSFTMFPFFGVEPLLLDNEFKIIEKNDAHGYLVIKSSTPGMARTILNDHQAYMNNYYNKVPGYYYTGDGAYRDENGFYKITGRIDDVINVSGHRLSTADIEDALNHHYLSESAVVGVPHPIKGQCLVAFAVLKDANINISKDHVIEELNKYIRNHIGSFALPERIELVDALPKTRSGKIVRRVLKTIASGQTNIEDMGDLSTLADPNVIHSLLKKFQK